VRRLVLLVALAVLGAACAPRPLPTGPNVIGIANGTSVPVAMHVDGAWVGTYPAWAESAAAIPLLPGGPAIRVEFRTPDDEFVAGMVVDPDAPSGTSARWITSCGTLVVWHGPRTADAPVIDPAAARPPGPPCH
jgi:hypothetical protein